MLVTRVTGRATSRPRCRPRWTWTAWPTRRATRTMACRPMQTRLQRWRTRRSTQTTRMAPPLTQSSSSRAPPPAAAAPRAAAPTTTSPSASRSWLAAAATSPSPLPWTPLPALASIRSIALTAHLDTATSWMSKRGGIMARGSSQAHGSTRRLRRPGTPCAICRLGTATR
ncbi:uncharacterized protein CC84DRAFT_429625 [Paraphaeosphaeria sporulosa]|uniref:Uncharacterized protein n=1 Tax=Paraphaeosphaeria sporulosa TaxID=1460663 RepID=A0A177BVI9_9PLEO|nr:uncharacterized protein CC84DRAFT_429625 [Paraphaeosphaeria sporulosa]OAF98557.1 hypothetical protein CC84DRAFT_429625 [Paraphaeosphaeria sporulosa]